MKRLLSHVFSVAVLAGTSVHAQQLNASADSAQPPKEISVPAAQLVDTAYVDAIIRKVRHSTKYNGITDVTGNPRASFRIEQLPTGEIISVRKTMSSGIPAFDDAVLRGINNSSPLPKKKDGTVERLIEVGMSMKSQN